MTSEVVALTQEDLQSRTWAKVMTIAQRRLDELRVENDADKDPTATAKQRGRIAEVKRLLAMGEPDPAAIFGSDDIPAG